VNCCVSRRKYIYIYIYICILPYTVNFSLSRDLVVCDNGRSGVFYFIITHSEDKYLIYWHFNECVSLMVCLGSRIFTCAIFDSGIFQDIRFFFLPTGQSGHDLTWVLAGLKACDKFRSEWLSSKTRFLNPGYSQHEAEMLNNRKSCSNI
jgi:hypothetical protein